MTLLRSPAIWTKDQLEALYATFPDSVKDRVGERKHYLMRLSSLSGTPGVFTLGDVCDPGGPKRATMLELEWHRGMKALYGQTQMDLAPHVVEGRFPDRNGIYHHSDLVEL